MSSRNEVDIVNHPTHYIKGGIECIDYIESRLDDVEFRGFLRGTMMRYADRLMDKENPPQDAAKLEWYAKKLKIHMENCYGE